MLHFYHHGMSPYSQKVFFLLEEAGHSFDLRVIGLEKRQHRESNYLAVNAAGRVPAIDHSGFRLAESNAIMRYLTSAFAIHSLYPVGLKERADIDQWWEFCSHHINKPLLDLAWNKWLAPQFGAKSSHEVVSYAFKCLRRDLPILENHLLSRNYISGPELTLADINLAPFAVYMPGLFAMDQYPAIHRWMNLVHGRQSWRNVAALM